MSADLDEAAVARVREFKIEMELLIATMLAGVPLSAVEKVFGSDSMTQIVAKTLAPVRRAVRR